MLVSLTLIYQERERETIRCWIRVVHTVMADLGNSTLPLQSQRPRVVATSTDQRHAPLGLM